MEQNAETTQDVGLTVLQAFATNLKSLREVSKLTTEELALKVGITEEMLIKYETAECFPEVQTLVSIGDTFGVSVDLLLGLLDDSHVVDLTNKYNTLFNKFKKLEAAYNRKIEELNNINALISGGHVTINKETLN